MIALLVLFALSFFWVFVMAFQSRNINAGNYGWAAGMSFFIGFLQVQVLGTVLQPGASTADTLTYCLGGMFGVVSAMLVHRRFLHNKK